MNKIEKLATVFKELGIDFTRQAENRIVMFFPIGRISNKIEDRINSFKGASMDEIINDKSTSWITDEMNVVIEEDNEGFVDWLGTIPSCENYGEYRYIPFWENNKEDV